MKFSVEKGEIQTAAYKDIEPSEESSEEKSEKHMSSAGALKATAGYIREVFAYWQYRMGHPQAKLTPEREKKISARLKEGYTVAQIKQGIDGCRASPHHQGQNDNGTIYDDITLICRNGSKLEWFIAMTETGNGGTKRSAVRHETKNTEGNAKVLDSWAEDMEKRYGRKDKSLPFDAKRII